MIRLAIFDFDGTLGDSFAWFTRVLNDVAARYRFKQVEPHEIEMLRRLGARQIIKHLGVPAWKLPLIANHMRKRKAKDISQTKVFPGVDTMLRTLLERGVAAAIVSSNAEDNIRTVLGPQNAALIAHYECGAPLFGKAARFRRILQRSGCPASEAICIGDEIRDHEAATRAGIAFGAVTWGYTRADALAAKQPAAIFRSVAEIAERLRPSSPSPDAA